ncbi:sarcosine oxidase subunit gamma [Bradyrhizobium sp. HKCCYLR20261]|uniref:sarcosine oxidase subunit gamma n=1 Tax=Bradyrhizobium sp. HKCCYLR20261 TaxID=3420760 RepID=UPI003EC04A20
MPDSSLSSRAALTDHIVPPQGSRVTIVERADLGLATLQARKGQDTALREAVQHHYGLTLPRTPAVVGTDSIAFVGLGPQHWLAVSDGRSHLLAPSLKAAIGPLGSVVDQSGGYAVVRVGGPAIRDVLAKGFPIDLHDRAFPPGAAATTVVGHIGAIMWRNADEHGHPCFDIAVFRSLSQSFWRWFSDAAAEFGGEVKT